MKPFARRVFSCTAFDLFLRMYTLKKSLGQHFLKDENISRKIVDAVVAQPLQRLVEVGPGGGALTKYLVGIPGIDFKAVEVDDEKVAFLLKTYPSLEGKIIHRSFLDIDQPFEQPFTVVGNFPYNISTQIIFKILDWTGAVDMVIGMFQKEVAQRIAAHEGSKVYGVTSVLVQAFFKVEYLFDVSETAFNPPPKVKSGVIRLTPVEHPVQMRSREHFFRLVKAAFGQRRKTMRNACRSLFDADQLQDPLFDKRAEQLPVDTFAQLTFRMQ
jgi:16S rRNA (adenine1518-N6/adenine1519-N6)-dimethyltransferase